MHKLKLIHYNLRPVWEPVGSFRPTKVSPQDSPTSELSRLDNLRLLFIFIFWQIYLFTCFIQQIFRLYISFILQVCTIIFFIVCILRRTKGRYCQNFYMIEIYLKVYVLIISQNNLEWDRALSLKAGVKRWIKTLRELNIH